STEHVAVVQRPEHGGLLIHRHRQLRRHVHVHHPVAVAARAGHRHHVPGAGGPREVVRRERRRARPEVGLADGEPHPGRHDARRRVAAAGAAQVRPRRRRLGAPRLHPVDEPAEVVAGGRLRHPPVHVAGHVGERRGAQLAGAHHAVRYGQHVAEVGPHGAVREHPAAPVDDDAHAARPLTLRRRRPGVELPQVGRERLQLRAPGPRRVLQGGGVGGGDAVDAVDGGRRGVVRWRRRGAERGEQAVDQRVGGR
ncbi:Os04g0609525, partial [Oryza sativa Japonica Group]